MTVRAVILGVLLAALVSVAGYVNDQLMHLTYFVGNHLPIGVFGMLLLAAMVFNPALRALRKRWAFRPSELAVVLALVLAACSIPGSSLLRSFYTSLVYPLQMHETNEGWKKTGVLDYVPRVMMPGDPGEPVGYNGEVVDGYLKGVGDPEELCGFDEVPWRLWGGPFLFWGTLLGLFASAPPADTARRRRCVIGGFSQRAASASEQDLYRRKSPVHPLARARGSSGPCPSSAYVQCPGAATLCARYDPRGAGVGGSLELVELDVAQVAVERARAERIKVNVQERQLRPRKRERPEGYAFVLRVGGADLPRTCPADRAKGEHADGNHRVRVHLADGICAGVRPQHRVVVSHPLKVVSRGKVVGPAAGGRNGAGGPGKGRDSPIVGFVPKLEREHGGKQGRVVSADRRCEVGYVQGVSVDVAAVQEDAIDTRDIRRRLAFYRVVTLAARQAVQRHQNVYPVPSGAGEEVAEVGDIGGRESVGVPGCDQALSVPDAGIDEDPDDGEAVPGDTDGDGDVDLDDLFAVRNNFGTTSGATKADGDVEPHPGGDDDVDLDDLFNVRNNFGTGMLIPEPMTLSVMALGGLALIPRKR